MTQKSSSVKGDSVLAVFQYALSRYKNILIAYSVLSFVLGPLLAAINLISGSGIVNYAFSFLIKLTACALAVCLPLLMFYYVNNKQAIDVFHSLPVTRKSLYWGNYLAGLLIILAPLLVFGGGCDLIFRLQQKEDYLLWTLTVIIIAFCFYSTMVFVIINCGTIFESIVYFGIFEIGVPGFFLVLFEYIHQTTYGYSSITSSIYEELCYAVSPFYQLFHVGQINLKSLIPVGISLILVVCGFQLYQKRKSESAGQSFAYKPFFYVGAILISVTAGIGAAILTDYSEVSRAIVALAGILTGLVTYFVLDTIRNRGFKNIKSTLKIGGISAATALTFFCIYSATGAFGFEKRVPTLEEVKGVAVQWNYYSEFLENNYLSGSYIFEEKENIQSALSFHQSFVLNQQAVEEKNYKDVILPYPSENWPEAISDSSQSCQTVTLTYTLENGNTVVREYLCPLSMAQPLALLCQSEEYVRRVERETAAAKGFDCGSISFYTSGDKKYENSRELSQEEAASFQQAVIEDLSYRKNLGYFNNEEIPLGLLCFSLGQQKYRLFDTGEILTMEELEQKTKKGFQIPAGDSNVGYYYTDNITYLLLPIYPSDAAILRLLKEYALLLPLEQETVFYIPKDQKDSLHNNFVEEKFYLAGSYAYYDYEKELLPSGEKFELSSDQMRELMLLISPTRYSSQAEDIILIGSTVYLVPEENREKVLMLFP